ncbi:MAG: energy-coupling factor transporter ATPase [Caldilineaceae bacterium]|nr:energy-coupling factor transporter ATPase [Caldilineaceae bacterium]
MEPIIRLEQVEHIYNPGTPQAVPALRNLSLTIHQGEYVVILGHNGSGKSTLARHLNGLLLPTQGDVWVKAWNTKDKQALRAIRATVGMVFQTPDNQIVATIVEEDVAFGPENLAVPPAEMSKRVQWSLEQVDMWAFRHRAPHLLSGGQKQRICIAGVLAMQPDVLVLDESTAMLDPRGREEVLAVAHRLHREQGVTVVAITHFMQEAVAADRVIVMADGQIVLQGTPRELFRQADQLRALQLDIPPITELALALHEQIPTFPPDLLTPAEFVTAVQQHRPAPISTPHSPVSDLQSPASTPPLIALTHVVHDYMRDTPLQVRALHDIDLTVHRGEIVGLIGHTGSGKSTVIQHMNGLLRPHAGQVVILGQDVNDRGVDLRALRQRVGLVFQFPEAQLFERYVGDDIAYGPRNLKLSREEVRARVQRAMTAVGLDFTEFKDRMTFSLSGGQKRRVALAGVLALEPAVLILDEPTAGLDPAGRQQLMDALLALHRQGTTLVLISHNMEEMAAICHRLYLLADGRTALSGTPAQIFAELARIQTLGINAPAVTLLFDQLAKADILTTTHTIYTQAQALQTLQQHLRPAATREEGPARTS